VSFTNNYKRQVSLTQYDSNTPIDSKPRKYIFQNSTLISSYKLNFKKKLRIIIFVLEIQLCRNTLGSQKYADPDLGFQFKLAFKMYKGKFAEQNNHSTIGHTNYLLL